ncbi:MAG: aminomethyl-transferring glycine dehydrogenase subunit GcvPA [Chthonomonadales bacterium]|nr:aminomethyl-transferring glycine dehydrogenase subunit GcvPA [Chthonomonadales bacterium]
MTYVPHTPADRVAMLEAIGARSIADLFGSIPAEARMDGALDLPDSLDEAALLRHLTRMAGRNDDLDRYACFLGAGVYDHFGPSVVDALASRGEFLTAYTPYQPEMSQGMLQAIYEYQSLVCRLTGMELANASMYDGATALAEAALMAVDVTGRDTVVASSAIHPHYRRVVRTYIRTSGFQYREAPHRDGALDTAALGSVLDGGTACLLTQYPSFFGCVHDLAAAQSAAAAAGALSVVCADPVALGLLKPPGEFGVDVVVGEGQALGCPMAFGGPLLGFFACKLAYQRRFPGRIVGATRDLAGRRAYTMTLRTREQDIRRERATSNICTNEALLALAATIYLCAVGRNGLREVADRCVQKAHYAADRLCALPGVSLAFERPFFKEFALRLPPGTQVAALNRRLRESGVIGGYDLGLAYPELAGHALLCVTENRTREEIDRMVSTTASALREGVS